MFGTAVGKIEIISDSRIFSCKCVNLLDIRYYTMAFPELPYF